jgi:hypothetical protein
MRPLSDWCGQFGGIAWHPGQASLRYHTNRRKIVLLSILNLSRETNPLGALDLHHLKYGLWCAYQAFQTEQTCQAELMAKSVCNTCDNAYLRILMRDSLILQAKIRGAKAEMELYTLAFESTHEFDFSDNSEDKTIMCSPSFLM